MPTIKPSKPHIRYKPTTCCLPERNNSERRHKYNIQRYIFECRRWFCRRSETTDSKSKRNGIQCYRQRSDRYSPVPFPPKHASQKRRALPSRRKRQLHNHQWRNPARYFQRDSNPRLITQKQTIPAKLENIAINDYPDLLYRGMMFDIARNFTKKADLFKTDKPTRRL